MNNIKSNIKTNIKPNNMIDVALKNLVKELNSLNKDFEKYKKKYMDKDNMSTMNEVREELLNDMLDMLEIDEECRKEKKIEKRDICTVCINDMGDKNKCVLKCGHKFHFDCIMKLMNTDTPYSNKCPLCRIEFNKKSDSENGENGTMQTIHNISMRLGGLSGTLIHAITHLDEQQIITLTTLLDVLE